MFVMARYLGNTYCQENVKNGYREFDHRGTLRRLSIQG